MSKRFEIDQDAGVFDRSYFKSVEGMIKFDCAPIVNFINYLSEIKDDNVMKLKIEGERDIIKIYVFTKEIVEKFNGEETKSPSFDFQLFFDIFNRKKNKKYVKKYLKVLKRFSNINKIYFNNTDDGKYDIFISEIKTKK